MKPKVSIVLPVYNAGIYLRRCINSLLSQTLKEIEIIIILDCPTDGSDKVAKEFAGKDDRIKIIENDENLRVGFSRNKGIEAATGEYIGFCDHDDYAESEMYEKLYNCIIKYNYDIAICDVNSIDEKGNLRKIVKHPSGDGVDLKEKMLSAVLKIYHNYGKTVWNILFKKDFLDSYCIRFDDNKVITSDDCLLLSKSYFLTDNVVHCESLSGLYNHVGYPGSTLYSYSFLNVDLVLNFISKLDEFIRSKVPACEKNKYKYDIAHGTIQHLYTGFRKELKFKGLINAYHKIKKIRRNKIVLTNIRPFFSKGGIKYIKQLAPTKLMFLLIIYI